MVERLNLEMQPTRTNPSPVYAPSRAISPGTVNVGNSFPTYEEKDKKGNVFSKMFDPKKLKKANMVAVLYLRNSGIAQPLYVESNKGMFVIDDRTYHEREDCKYLLGKDRIPLAVIPEAGLIPVGNKEYFAKKIEARCAEHQDMAIKAIRHAEIVRMAGEENKGKINAKLVIALTIGAIIVFALLKNYV